jgi:hypothetical protein
MSRLVWSWRFIGCTVALLGIVAAGRVEARGLVPTRAVPLAPIAKADVQRCRGLALLRPACPLRAPVVEGKYRTFATRDGEGTRYPPLHVFDMERVGPRPPTDAAWLRPPYGVHITVAAGDVKRLTPFIDPTPRTRATRLTERIRSSKRTKAVSFGMRRWNGMRGILYLAPPYPNGGQLGDHLAFQWSARGRTNVVSLHSWSPLQETERALRQMVNSIPR